MEQVSMTRDQLLPSYMGLLIENPLLARVEGECRSLGWDDEEIRTMQLLVACRSNASLKDALEKARRSIGQLNKI